MSGRGSMRADRPMSTRRAARRVSFSVSVLDTLATFEMNARQIQLRHSRLCESDGDQVITSFMLTSRAMRPTEK